jgi:hypothetical protein
MRLLVCTLTLLGFVAPSGALAQAGRLNVSVMVPEICELHANPLIIDDQQSVVTGCVFEACNGSGFQIFASHRPLLQTESVSLSYGNMTRALSLEGMTHVTTRAGARVGYQPVVVEQSGLSAPLVLSLSVVTL